MTNQKTYTDEEIAQALRFSSGLFAAKLAGEIEETKELLREELRLICDCDTFYYSGKRMGLEIALRRLNEIQLDDDDMGGL